MRKFTSLMLMLLCAVTTWAGPTDLPEISTVENPIYYTISNTRSSSGRLLYYTTEGVKDATPQVLTDAYKFFFTGTSLSDLKIHNAEAEKTEGGALLFAGSGAWTTDGVSVEICETPCESKPGTGLAIKFNSTSLNEQNFGNGYTTWGANDEGSIFVIDLARDINWPEADKFYVIEAPLFYNTQGVNKGLLVNEDGSLGWNTIDLTSTNCYWTVEYNADNDGYAVKNLGTGKYLNGAAMSETVENYAKFNYLSQYQFNIVINGTTVHANNHGNGANASGNVVSWGGSIGSASAWKFIEKRDPSSLTELDITYNFTYKGKTLEGYTQTVSTFVGEEYPDITVSFPFGVSATKPEGTIAADAATTVTIAVEENLPFEYAAEAGNIKNWYYIQQHSSAGYGKYLQYAETYIEWADAKIVADEADTYTWAFVGDPFNGFKMVNYGAPENANAVVSTGSGNPSFGAFADATAWNIKASATNADAEHFCFQYPGSNQYMNAQSGKIAFWGDADQGSTMWVTERDMTGLADLQALIDQVDAAIAAYGQGGTTVGFYTAESTAVLATKLGEAKAAAEANESAAANTAAQVALQNAVAALETIQPEEDKFYYIASAMPETDGRSGQKMYVNADGGMQFENASTLRNAFQFVPADNNTFYLYNVCTGLYLSTNKGHNGGQAETKAATTEGAVKVTISNMGRENVVKIVPVDGAMLHAQAAGSSVVAWNNNENTSASAWTIDEISDITALSHTATVSAAGYSTLCIGYNAAIPAEVKCYVVSSTTNGWAHLEQITGVLPANTPVILENAGEFEFTYSTETPATIESNELKGSTIKKEITEDSYSYYILAAPDGAVGLYKDEFSDNKFVNNAFKAYLEVPAETAQGALSYGFTFGGTTAIEGIEAVAGEQAIYDLTGRKIDAITAPGLYIINGVKTIVE